MRSLVDSLIDKVNNFKYSKSQEILKQFQEIIEDKIPCKWENGDVRYIDSTTFKILKNLLYSYSSLYSAYENLAKMDDIIYIGSFGTLIIKDISNFGGSYEST